MGNKIGEGLPVVYTVLTYLIPVNKRFACLRNQLIICPRSSVYWFRCVCWTGNWFSISVLSPNAGVVKAVDVVSEHLKTMSRQVTTPEEIAQVSGW